MSKNNIIYSTDPDYRSKCPVCDEYEDECICKQKMQDSPSKKTIQIRREIKGRGGKTVTTLSGFGNAAKQKQKELQKLCGAGGTVKQGVIEIQGDHRQKIKDYLNGQGFVVKFTGG